MASAIAMSGNPVFMAANALMMIHDPYTFAAGTSEELRKSADLLDTMKGNLVRAYTQKTGLPEKEIEDMMAEETWLGATEAVALGFVDAIEDGVAAAAQVTPEKARARFDTLKKVMANSPQDTITQEPPDEPIVPETEPVAETNEAPAPEPTVVPHPPVEPTDPVARVDVAAITAQLTEAYARIERAEARAAKAEADLHTVQATLSNLEKSKGLSPAAVVPEVKPESQILSKTDFDALSPYAKAEFFRRGGKLS
jgi:hypothetical protein